MSWKFCHVRGRGVRLICDICILTVKIPDGMIEPEFADVIFCKMIIIKLAGIGFFKKLQKDFIPFFQWKTVTVQAKKEAQAGGTDPSGRTGEAGIQRI